jgi:hypothetical protein
MTGTIPTPSYNSKIPNVNLSVPVKTSCPIDDRRKPKALTISALIMDPLVKKISIVIPKIIREKYSGGPNFKAKFTRGGAMKVSPTTPKVPAMKDPKAAIPSAGPALPWSAI